MQNRFEEWWSKYRSKPRGERIRNFNSLSKSEQTRLQQSFLKDGWCHLFCQNYIDSVLDQINKTYKLDLIDMRIKALKYNRVFLVERDIWDSIKKIISEYDPLYDSEIIFGGLSIRSWGRKNNFYRIMAKGE